MRTRRRGNRISTLGSISALLFLGACADGPTEPGSNGLLEPIDLAQPWESGNAAAEGFDSESLNAAYGAAASLENIRALIVVRNGKLIREAYFNETTAETPLDVRSVTKTVTALVVGIAEDEGALDVEDPIRDWIDPALLRPDHDAIRVRHLLTMTSGIEWTDQANFNPWVQSGRPVGYVLDLPVVAAPDQRFMYNTGGSHLLAVIVAAATGGDALAFADDRLFGPLGMRDRRIWPVIGGQPAGGVALRLPARDLARLGQLVLQRGRSGDRQLVSESYVDEAFRPRIPLGAIGNVLEDGGYGYQVWTESQGSPAYVMWGFGGQFVWVVPDKDLVVVAASHWSGIGYDGSARQANALGEFIREHIVASAR